LPDNVSYHATDPCAIGGNHGSICALGLVFGYLAAELAWRPGGSPRNPDVRMVPVPGCATGQAALASTGYGGHQLLAATVSIRPQEQP
jgi:hypothetical protein